MSIVDKANASAAPMPAASSVFITLMPIMGVVFVAFFVIGLHCRFCRCTSIKNSASAHSPWGCHRQSIRRLAFLPRVVGPHL